MKTLILSLFLPFMAYCQCENIVKFKDKFTDIEYSKSEEPLLIGDAAFFVIAFKGKDHFNLDIMFEKFECVSPFTDVVFLLSNGEKITLANFNKHNCKGNTYVKIGVKEIELIYNKVTDVRVYFDEGFKDIDLNGNSEKLSELLMCAFVTL